MPGRTAARVIRHTAKLVRGQFVLERSESFAAQPQALTVPTFMFRKGGVLERSEELCRGDPFRGFGKPLPFYLFDRTERPPGLSFVCPPPQDKGSAPPVLTAARREYNTSYIF